MNIGTSPIIYDKSKNIYNYKEGSFYLDSSFRRDKTGKDSHSRSCPPNVSLH